LLPSFPVPNSAYMLIHAIDSGSTRHVESSGVRMYAKLIICAVFSLTPALAVLLIRTYAFFSRNAYVLWFLLSALSGVVAYQLYVDTTQMLRKFCLFSEGASLSISSSSFLSPALRKSCETVAAHHR
jgi:hypothetical protein